LTHLEVGVVSKPHGIRGELRVHLHWAQSDALGRVSTLRLVCGDREIECEVEQARPAGRAYLLRLKGYNTREAAETLRQCRVLVDRAALPPLEPGEYYLAELVGFEVLVGGLPFGEVVEIRTHPSVDSVVIKTPAGELVEQPLSEPWLERVDVAGGRLLLNSEEGLIR
jgi:16S rRNA processing protein RimM